MVNFDSIVDVNQPDVPYVTDGKPTDFTSQLLQNGDVIIADTAEDDTAGKVIEVTGINDNYAVSGLHTIVGRPNIKFAYKYLGYYLNAPSYHNTLLPLMQGIKVLSLSKSNIAKTVVRFPKNVSEQTSIGVFFNKLENLITQNGRKIDLLKQLKQSYLQKIFSQELRFAGFSDDWEERKLRDYIIQYSEKTKHNNQYPVFTSSRNGLFFQKEYYKGHQIASEDNVGYNIVPRGYFTYRHMSDDLVFKFNINDLADYGIVSTLYPVFTTNEQLDSKYLQYQLNEGSEFKRFSLLQKQGGSRTYMYLNKLQNMILNIPQLKEQIKIGSFFKQLDNLIFLHQQKLSLLKKQKQAFLQKMFI